jgi:hypothetical protein
LLLSFLDNLSTPSSRVKQSKKKCFSLQNLLSSLGKIFVVLKSKLAHSPFILRLYKLDILLKKTFLTECKRYVGSFDTNAKSTGFFFILFNYIALCSDFFTSALHLCCEQGYFGVKQFNIFISCYSESSSDYAGGLLYLV